MNKLSLIVLVGLGLGAHADAGMLGTWTLERMTCSSGANQFTGPVESEVSVDGLTTVTETELATEFKLRIKYGPEHVKSEIENLTAEMARSRSQPDSAARLAELQKQIDQTRRYAGGMSCSVKERMSYTLVGHLVHTGRTIERSTDCPDADDDHPGSDATVEITGDQMKVTEGEVDTGSCPPGDHSIAIFSRVKQ